MSEILTPEQVEAIAEKANVLAQFAQNTGALEDYSCLVHNIPALIATIQAAWAERDKLLECWDKLSKVEFFSAYSRPAAALAERFIYVEKQLQKAEAERAELQKRVQELEADLKANASMLAKTERDRIMKLLHDLTPMGSEFANSPERCAKWIQDAISSSTQLAVKAYAERNKAEAERDQALQRATQMEQILKHKRLKWDAVWQNVIEVCNLVSDYSKYPYEEDTAPDVVMVSQVRHAKQHVDKLQVQLKATEQLQAERDQYRAEAVAINDVLTELLEVADLRGDTDLPHPADDPKTWTARMQEAWDAARDALTSTTLSAKHIERDKAMQAVCEAATRLRSLGGMAQSVHGDALCSALDELKAVQGEQEGEGCEI